MKKNYIAPNTEMASWASMGLMQEIAFATGSGSCGATVYQTIDDVNRID